MMPILSAIMPIAETVIERLVPDKNAKAKAMREMEKALVDAHNQGALAQLEINKVEAGHRSIFVAGWRPCIGWVGAFAIGWHFLVQPLTIFLLGVFGLSYDLPHFDMDSLMTIVLGMLGIGGMRSFEKFKGLTK
jgi:hypothetical protein